MKWYNVELPYETVSDRATANKFKVFLKMHKYEYEPSIIDKKPYAIHFEINLTQQDAQRVNDYLDTLNEDINTTGMKSIMKNLDYSKTSVNEAIAGTYSDKINELIIKCEDSNDDTIYYIAKNLLRYLSEEDAKDVWFERKFDDLLEDSNDIDESLKTAETEEEKSKIKNQIEDIDDKIDYADEHNNPGGANKLKKEKSNLEEAYDDNPGEYLRKLLE